MTLPKTAWSGGRADRVVEALRARFSLHEDRAEDSEIDTRLRADVVMRGTNLWVLMFAIFIASIGLNVNSTAVIIGAMLISPLMGPIIGLGYGAGIFDLGLVRHALKNLGIATLIGLLTSTAYFAISPLTTAQSELLARMTPTIWDVLIAVFGGLAGIVAVTRKHKSNVIPGVAIATALMPPLCTAGFGLATGAWGYFLGAFYLFTINCVFIAAAATLVTRAFHMQTKSFVDKRAEARVHLYLAIVVTATLLPSLYLAYRLVGEELFRSRAAQFVTAQFQFTGTHIADVTIDPKRKLIQVSLVGSTVPRTRLTAVGDSLRTAGLDGADLEVFQNADQHIDIATLRTSLLGDLVRESKVGTAANVNAIQAKDSTIQQLQGELSARSAESGRFRDVPAEVYALYPEVTAVVLSDAPEWSSKNGVVAQHVVVANVWSQRRLTTSQRDKLAQWLRVRCKTENVRLLVQLGRQP